MHDSPASTPSTSPAYIRPTSTTMMSVASQDSSQLPPYYIFPIHPVSSQRPQSQSQSQSQQEVPYLHYQNINNTYALNSFNVNDMATATSSHRRPQQDDASVAQALEIARESPDGSSDPTISKILEAALTRIWAKVKMHPNSYVMTRDEFAVFNFFQYRFDQNEDAVNARKRYWDNTHA